MWKKPCIGLCFLNKLRGVEVDEEVVNKRKARKPCIGLCYIMKLNNEGEMEGGEQALEEGEYIEEAAENYEDEVGEEGDEEEYEGSEFVNYFLHLFCGY